MRDPRVVELGPADLDRIKPLLVDLFVAEQVHFPDHPQLGREEIEHNLGVPRRFEGENVFLAVADPAGVPIGFCWVVLFDPGTGLEGEVAELFVRPDHRGQGVGEALVRHAVGMFRDRGVTLGYVWTRVENQAAVRLYEGAGFEPSRQLVMTWYPV